MTSQPMHHGTCVAIDGYGVLLRGPSGCGKSDLALRLIETPPSSVCSIALVADDQVQVSLDDGRLIASAPPILRGKLEVRGLGILDIPCIERAELKLVADLLGRHELERLPELPEATTSMNGIEVPILRLDPFELSAPIKLALAVSRMDQLFSK